MAPTRLSNRRRHGSSSLSPSHNADSNNNNGSMKYTVFTILRTLALSMASLYVGFYLGFKEGVAQTTSRMLSEQQQCKQQNVAETTTVPTMTQVPPKSREPIFPTGTKAFMSGMSIVDRNEFARQFDVGVPLFESSDSNHKVVLLHASKSLPTNASIFATNSQFSVQEATANCQYLSLILTEPHRDDQCIAIMGQFNSYHVSKFMRTTPNKHPAEMDPTSPLQLVKRTMDTRAFHTATPTLQNTRQYWQLKLQPYLTNLESYLEKLRPIAEAAAAAQHHNTIIVMVSNHGQSELLLNFVCNAHAKQLDTSMVVVFATDVETHSLATNLGLHSFYDQQLFDQIPKQHAAKFGDATYKMAIFSKLYCVHLIGLLGYDYLFQDVDLIWYKQPLEFFHQHNTPPSPNNSNDSIDIYMQNDGNYAQFYMPYSGNTGFYYVKNNARTQYFMNHFLVSGDLIMSTSTHQAPFLSLLSEHASLHGLRVKILPGDDFPGGMQYQRKHQYMKQLMRVDTSRQVDPWIFHMSWTINKDHKIQFFQQMGEWFVQPTCMPNNNGANTTQSQQHCCAANPITKCHFRDMPSSIPCHDSPPFSGKRPSFHPPKQ